jgi:hypothetical protein
MTSIPLSDMEGSGAAARFDDFGDKYAGRITAMKQTQQTDPKTGQPKFFPSGDPMMLWIITIQPEGGGDALSLWAKAGKFTAAKGSGQAMLTAIGAAVRESGASSVEVGGKLAVAFTGESEPKPGMNPAKLFSAQYEPPTAEPASVPVDLFS